MNNPLDLEAIRHRYDTLTATAGPDALLPACWSAADVPALVAEVERLRTERADIWDAGYEDGMNYRKSPNPYS